MNWLKAIQEAVYSDKKDIVEKGYKTTKQWSTQIGVSEVQMRRYIHELTDKKLCDCKLFKIKNLAGHYKNTTHYNIKINPKCLK